MAYFSLQKQIYANKLNRGFNVTDIGKEIILMTEELSELSEAIDDNSLEGKIDALGDMLVYALGLCEMFGVNSYENIIYEFVESTQDNYFRRLARETGLIAKTLKKSNKKSVDAIDRREEFIQHIGKLMGYCIKNLEYLGNNPEYVVENIVNNNRKRTHEGNI